MLMLGLSLISAAMAWPHQGSSIGRSTQLHAGNSTWHTIPLFQQVPHPCFEPRRDADVHAFIKAEGDRVMAKHHLTFDRFKEATGQKHFLDKRSEANRTAKRTDGETSLIPVRGSVAWVGMIVVGTGRGQAPVTAKFDTGALDLIVHHGQYDYSRSTYAEHTGNSFELAYSDGTRAEGRVMLDTVFVADLVAFNLAIGDATTSTVNAYDYQAVVGMTTLVRPEVSALRRPGLIRTLYAQRSIERKLFCFGLWKVEDARLDIGHIAPQYRGLMSWTHILNPQFGMWTAPFLITGVEVVQTAVVDTGTRLVIGPYDLVFNVITAAGMGIRQHDGQLYGTYPTNGPRPYVAISIAGLNVVLSDDSLKYQYHEELTVAGIVGKRDMDGWWILGATFLQNVYAVFDADRLRMGFALH
ncbi:hypothetical protein V8E36_007355 [Tilletia maclaganii]